MVTPRSFPYRTFPHHLLRKPHQHFDLVRSNRQMVFPLDLDFLARGYKELGGAAGARGSATGEFQAYRGALR